MKKQESVREALKEAYSRGEFISFFLSLESHMRRLEGGKILCELHNAEKISRQVQVWRRLKLLVVLISGRLFIHLIKQYLH